MAQEVSLVLALHQEEPLDVRRGPCRLAVVAVGVACQTSEQAFIGIECQRLETLTGVLGIVIGVVVTADNSIVVRCPPLPVVGDLACLL